MASSDEINYLLSLSPYDFEQLIAQLLTLDGAQTVSVTKQSRDGGVDCVANFPSSLGSTIKVIVQAKRYSDTPVGEPVIRDLYGTMHHEKAASAYLITTSTFTSSAIDFVSGKPIELIDGQKLVVFLKKHGLMGKQARAFNTDKDDTCAQHAKCKTSPGFSRLSRILQTVSIAADPSKVGDPITSCLIQMKRQINKHWLRDKVWTLYPNLQHRSKLKIVAFFNIHNNGDICNLRIMTSSGVLEVDAAALRAVKKASPFLPLLGIRDLLPDNSLKSEPIEFKFDF